MSGFTQVAIARRAGVSQSILSELFNNKREIGKATAKRLGEFTGVRWTRFFDMDGADIRRVLIEACESRAN